MTRPPTAFLAAFLLTPSSLLAQPQMAAQYAAAEAAARQAATKACPADAACNLSMAAYYGCLGNQLGPGRTPRCAAPTCTLGKCPGASASAAQPGGFQAPPNTPPGLSAFNQAADGLRGMLEESERRRAAQQGAELNQAEQLYASQQQRSAELQRLVDQANRELAETAALEVKFRAGERLSAEERRVKRVKEMAARTLTSPAFPGEVLRSLEPAEGNEKCGPWMAMKNANGVVLEDLDIAYCGFGMELPSADLRDLPLSWLIRNRTAEDLELKYQLSIQCIRVCTSGWYGFEQTVPAGKVVGYSRGSFGGWAIWQNRLVDSRVK